jgi:hypothetical protein
MLRNNQSYSFIDAIVFCGRHGEKFNRKGAKTRRKKFDSELCALASWWFKAGVLFISPLALRLLFCAAE